MHPVRKKLRYVESAVAALLKQNKFKKDKLTWRKEEAEQVYVFNLQLSQWNEENRVEFYVNLGVFDKIAYTKKYGCEEKKPKEWQCQKRARLDNLIGTKKSLILEESTDEKKLASQLVAEIKEFAFPWFDK